MPTEQINIVLNLFKGKTDGFKRLKKEIDSVLHEIELRREAIEKAVTPQQKGGHIRALNNSYKKLNNLYKDMAGYLDDLKSRYKISLMEEKKFRLETSKARLTFNRFFGVLLSGMFVFRTLANSINGFIRKSISAYLSMTSQQDVVAKSLMFLKGGFDALRYSFVQAMAEIGVFRFLADALQNVLHWWENLTAEQKKFFVGLTLGVGVFSTIIAKLSEIGILILALNSAFPALIPSIVGFVSSAVSAIFGFVSSVFGAIVGFISGIPALAGVVIGLLIALAVGWVANWKETIGDLWNSIKRFFADTIELFKNLFFGIWNMIMGFISILKGETKKGAKEIMNGVARIVFGVFDFILNTLYNGLKTFWNLVANGLNGLIKVVNVVLSRLGMKTISFRLPKLGEWRSNLTGWALNQIDKLFGEETAVTTTKETNVVNNNNVVININTTSQQQSRATYYGVASIMNESVLNALKRQGIGFY